MTRLAAAQDLLVEDQALAELEGAGDAAPGDEGGGVMGDTPTTTSVEIRSRWSGNVLFTVEVDATIPVWGRIKAAVQIAVGRGANLRGANLRGADLGGANLRDANLRGADLGDANLRGANLRGADLRGANLRGANLRDANLRGADLGDANLGGANLRGADLGDANLRGADLGGANLRGADLGAIKQDLIAEILRLPNELDALRDTIVAGLIDGSHYSGDCACLAGTLAKARGLDDYRGQDITANGVTFEAASSSPRERWFLGISIGDTPENSQVAAITLGWVNEAIAIRDMIRATAPTKEAV